MRRSPAACAAPSRLSTTTRARATTFVCSSRVVGSKAPTALTCAPVANHSPSRSGSRDEVTVQTRSAPRTASLTVADTSTSKPLISRPCSEGLCAGLGVVPHPNPAKRSNGRHRRQMGASLGAGADQRKVTGVRAGQGVGRNPRYGAGSDLGCGPAVKQGDQRAVAPRSNSAMKPRSRVARASTGCPGRT